jgi:DNA modification methylase
MNGYPTLQPDDWTFKDAKTRQLTHCYHDYPARMIPQVAGKLLDLYGPKSGRLFDPYCGSGTSLVEGMRRGLDVIGTDLNPLARLMSEAKTTPVELSQIDAAREALERFIADAKPQIVESVEGITRLDFWFKPEVSAKLAVLRGFANALTDASVRRFFAVALSETARECSNTRNEEFKLYRYEAARLERFAPDVYAVMRSKLTRNREGLREFLEALPNPAPSRQVFAFNTVEGVPPEVGEVDIVVTSPPYGDSGTTVAYGQYSRLSAAWLGLHEAAKIDQKLMGSNKLKELPAFPSPTLNEALREIAATDAKRAREVAAFYVELEKSTAHVAPVVKRGGHACYVVGNRKVKGVALPTDLAIRDFFALRGYEYVTTHLRGIPNKRMPEKNSPTNVSGRREETMTREYVVVMRRT